MRKNIEIESLGKCPNCESESFSISENKCPECGYGFKSNLTLSQIKTLYSKSLLNKISKDKERIKRKKIEYKSYESYEIILKGEKVFGIKYKYKEKKYLVTFSYDIVQKEIFERDYSVPKTAEDATKCYKIPGIKNLTILGIWKKVKVGYGEKFFIRNDKFLKNFIKKVIYTFTGSDEVK